MWDECGKLLGGLWNVIFTNFNFGTEFVMCQSIPNGGGGEVEKTNGATGHVSKKKLDRHNQFVHTIQIVVCEFCSKELKNKIV